MNKEIQFSKYDLKIKVKIPSLDNKLLAYETGVHIGDGSLQIIKSGTHSIDFGDMELRIGFLSQRFYQE